MPDRKYQALPFVLPRLASTIKAAMASSLNTSNTKVTRLLKVSNGSASFFQPAASAYEVWDLLFLHSDSRRQVWITIVTKGEFQVLLERTLCNVFNHGQICLLFVYYSVYCFSKVYTLGENVFTALFPHNWKCNLLTCFSLELTFGLEIIHFIKHGRTESVDVCISWPDVWFIKNTCGESMQSLTFPHVC